MSSRTYAVANDADVPALATSVHFAFGGTIEGSEKWLRGAGLEHSRVIRSAAGGGGGPLVASLLRIPMGQHFGGKSIPMLGIAGVTVMPEARGQGHAKWMMARAINEARAEGFPLSTLYASTQSLYRSVGYEQAGHKCVTRLGIKGVSVRAEANAPAIRPLGDRDEGAIRDCYLNYAANFAGTLDRGPYVWTRTRLWRDEKYDGFGAFDSANTLVGYLFLNQSRSLGATNGEITVSDLAFTTPAAGRRLLAFLADFGTMFSHITLQGPPLHPLVSLTDSRDFSLEKYEAWMLRICDVKKALETRGYPSHIKATLELRVQDNVVFENEGSWTMHVEHGRAEVRKESAMHPTLTLDIRALAPLFSGLYTARQLRALGWAEGENSAVAAADSIFGGFGSPWLGDFF